MEKILLMFFESLKSVEVNIQSVLNLFGIWSIKYNFKVKVIFRNIFCRWKLYTNPVDKTVEIPIIINDRINILALFKFE